MPLTYLMIEFVELYSIYSMVDSIEYDVIGWRIYGLSVPAYPVGLLSRP
jgi:hypothetical protein